MCARETTPQRGHLRQEFAVTAIAHCDAERERSVQTILEGAILVFPGLVGHARAVDDGCQIAVTGASATSIEGHQRVPHQRLPDGLFCVPRGGAQEIGQGRQKGAQRPRLGQTRHLKCEDNRRVDDMRAVEPQNHRTCRRADQQMFDIGWPLNNMWHAREFGEDQIRRGMRCGPVRPRIDDGGA